MVEGRLARGDVIAIGAAEGTESSVGLWRDRHNAKDGDVGREKPVELEDELFTIHFVVNVEVCHHQTCMNPRVGTSGTYDKELSPQEQRELLFDGFLDGHTVGLRLPSMVGGAIVLKIDEVSQLTVNN